MDDTFGLQGFWERKTEIETKKLRQKIIATHAQPLACVIGVGTQSVPCMSAY